jgi:wobble nucleotide-excising tRNase
MFEKLIKIQNVGRFQNFTAEGDTTFRRTTLIYAENGSGKTTLSTIFRSLSNGSSTVLSERHTIGETEAQSINLLAQGRRINFKNGTWGENLDNIFVFDSEFINQNVYAGYYVDLEQKRELYQFVIGSDQIELAKKIEELNEKGKRLTKEKQDLEKELKGYHGLLSLDEFLNIQNDSDIDQKLEDISKQILHKENENDIKKLSTLKIVTIPSIETPTLVDDLKNDLDTTTVNVAKKVKSHINNQLHIQNPEEWISAGVKSMSMDQEGDICPFCNQATADSDLIELFRLYFSNEYTNLVSTIENHLTKIDEAFGEKHLGQLENTILKNEKFLESWKRFLNIDLPTINRDEVVSKWRNIRGSLTAKLKTKQANPLSSIALENTLVENISNLSQTLAEYNDQIKAYNEQITLIQNQDVISVTDLKKERQMLQIHKQRFDPDVSTLCEGYTAILESKKMCDEDKKSRRKALDISEGDLLTQFQTSINQYLMNFGADFRIKENKKSMRGGKPSASYCVEIRNESISLGDAKTEGTPSFKSLLSEGDKSTLAFALFLAKLDSYPSLSESIVVIDDPVSSLDTHRQNTTCSRIGKLSKEVKQLILLSHNHSFLQDAYLNGAISKEETRLLFIKKIGADSKLIPWNMEETISSTYVLNFDAVQNYIERTEGDSLTVARALRPMLEENLRMRFPRTFTRNIWLGDFINNIRNAPSSTELEPMKPMLDEISDINEYTKDFHHGDGSGGKPVNSTELQTYARRTLRVMQGLPKTT